LGTVGGGGGGGDGTLEAAAAAATAAATAGLGVTAAARRGERSVEVDEAERLEDNGAGVVAVDADDAADDGGGVGVGAVGSRGGEIARLWRPVVGREFMLEPRPELGW